MTSIERSFAVLMSICLVTAPVVLSIAVGPGVSEAKKTIGSGEREPTPEIIRESIGEPNGGSLCNLQSEVRQDALTVTTGNIEPYETRAEKTFTSDFWSDIAMDDVESAVKSLKPDYLDVANDLLIKISGATAAGGATALMDIIVVGVHTLNSLQHSGMAAIIQETNNDKLRDNLRALAANGRSIDNEEDVTSDGEVTCDDYRQLFHQRRTLLEETYESLHQFETEAFKGRHRTTIHSERTQEQAYGHIRENVARLRTLLLLDYHATTSWLKNRPSGSNLAEETKIQMENRNLGTTQTRPWDHVSIGTLDSKNDFLLYEIKIPDKYTDRKKFKASVSPYVDNYEVYGSKSERPDVENPDVSDPTVKQATVNARGNKEITFREDDTFEEDDTFYILVKGENATTFKLETSVSKGFLDTGSPVKPAVVDEKKFAGYPAPVIESVEIKDQDNQIQVGENVIINVTVKNRGAAANWQSIAIGLPTLESTANVEITGGDLHSQVLPTGTEGVGARYGYGTEILEYPLIEASTTDWKAGATHHLKIRITGVKPGKMPVEVKSVANKRAVWKAAPPPGVGTVDQQGEWVRKRIIKIIESQSDRPARPSSPRPADGNSNISPSPTLEWSSNGADGVTYEVYFGSSSDPSLYTTTSSTSVSVGNLERGKRYYWRVVADNGQTTSSGDTWSFTTASPESGSVTVDNLEFTGENRDSPLSIRGGSPSSLEEGYLEYVVNSDASGAAYDLRVVNNRGVVIGVLRDDAYDGDEFAAKLDMEGGDGNLFQRPGSHSVDIITHAHESGDTTTRTTSVDVGLNRDTEDVTVLPVNAQRGEAVTLDASALTEDTRGDSIEGYGWRIIENPDGDAEIVKEKLGTALETITFTPKEATKYRYSLVNNPDGASGTSIDTGEVFVKKDIPSPSLRITDFSVPSTVTQGDRFSASIDLSNTGGAQANYLVRFKIDGDIKEVEAADVDAGESQSESATFRLLPGTYDIETVVIDGQNNRHVRTETITIEQNTPPTAAASPTPTEEATGVGLESTLTWSGDDLDGDSLSYALRLEAGDATPDDTVASDLSKSTYPLSKLDLESQTTYYWQIVATDEHGVTTAGPVWSFTTASQSNAPPIANATGTPSAVDAGNSLTLDASGSRDPNGDSLTYVWTQKSGPSVTIVNQTAEQLSFNVPRVEIERTLVFELTVIDNHGATSTDTVEVTVDPDIEAPSIRTTEVRFSNTLIESGQPLNVMVSLRNDGGEAGDEVPTLQVNGTEVARMVVQVNPNSSRTVTFSHVFENPGTYEVAVGNRVTKTVTVKAKQKPPSADTSPDQIVNEGASVTLDATPSSNPGDGDLSYSWTQTSGPSVSLQDANTTTPSFIAPSVDTDTTLTFQVKVTDGNGATDTDTVNITVQSNGSDRSNSQQPFGVATRDLSGRIQAENFDTGGEGVAYSDTTDENQYDTSYRDTAVDIRETQDQSGEYNVGHFEEGEWLEYTVDATSGTYDIRLRVATDRDDRQLRLSLGGETLETVDVPNTGGWREWETITAEDVSIDTNGTQVLRVEPVNSGIDVNWFEFASGEGSTSDISSLRMQPNSEVSGSIQNASDRDRIELPVTAGDVVNFTFEKPAEKDIQAHILYPENPSLPDIETSIGGTGKRVSQTNRTITENGTVRINVGRYGEGVGKWTLTNHLQQGADRWLGGLVGPNFRARYEQISADETYTGALQTPDDVDRLSLSVENGDVVNITYEKPAGEDIVAEIEYPNGEETSLAGPARTVLNESRTIREAGAVKIQILDPSATFIEGEVTGRWKLSVHKSEDTQLPFQGSPASLTSRIQAEDFDTGGEGVAYQDTTDENQYDTSYRDTAVDIRETQDQSGEYNIGHFEEGEWLEYTVNATSKTYDVRLRIATARDDRKLRLSLGGETLKTVDVPNTGGWSQWQTVTVEDVTIDTDGTQILRVEPVTSGIDFNWIDFQEAGSDDTSDEQQPYGGSARDLASRIQAQDFDTGGEGVAYRDTTDQNQYNTSYRDTAVDIRETQDVSGEYSIGYFEEDEWLEYTVDSGSGTYDLRLRVATDRDDRQLRLSLGGETLKTVDVPNTGGWREWQTVTVEDVSVEADATEVLRVEPVNSGIDVNWIEFTKAESVDDTGESGTSLSATRTIASQTVPAGQTTEVTVTIQTAAPTDDLRFVDGFDPSLSASIVDDDGATISSPADDEVAASWGGVSEATITYEVTIPDNASDGTTYNLSGTVEDRDAGSEVPIDGDATIEVGEPNPVAQYANDQDVVESTGLLDAAADFREGEIGSSVLLDVAAAFRSGEPVT